MLSIDYKILGLFKILERWVPSTAASALAIAPATAVRRFRMLVKREYLCRFRGHYEITDAGRQVLEGAKDNPVLRNPHPWIARVRAGLDTEGHELNLRGRAAIPSPATPEMSYEMDLDAFVDAKRAGLLDELLDD